MVARHGLRCGEGSEECQKHQKSPPTAPLHPWEWRDSPWSRIHLDYAGPFQGEMFLLILDAHSKWVDIYPVKTATSQAKAKFQYFWTS